jgi:hypothetical protein
MRAEEFITESNQTKIRPIHPDHESVSNNVRTSKDQNMDTGSVYLNWRMGVALAGAHSDKEKSVISPKTNHIQGDPYFSPYTKEELSMIKNASDMIGDKSFRRHSGPSHEPDHIHKVSPVKGFKGYPR